METLTKRCEALEEQMKVGLAINLDKIFKRVKSRPRCLLPASIKKSLKSLTNPEVDKRIEDFTILQAMTSC